MVVGVVGTLQFDVFEYRMKNEYGVDLRMSGLPYEHLRLIRECPCDVKDLMLCSGSRVLEDFKDRKLIAFGGEWSVGFLTKHNGVLSSTTGSACDFARKSQKHQKERGFRAPFCLHFCRKKGQILCWQTLRTRI